MNKKLVIVVPMNKENRVFANSCESGSHLNALRKFAYHSELDISESQFTESKEVAMILSELGYCVMLATEYEQTKNIEIFIPQKISSSQLEYFEKVDIKETLSHYNIVLYKYSKDKKLEIINKTNTENTVLSELMNELHNRITTTKVKTLTKSNNN